MKNLFRLCVLVVAVSCFGSAELSAQSKSKTKSKTTASKKTSSKKKSSGRLPRYFTHLKLDEAQRDEVRQIQADYKKQLADLNEKMAELKEEQQGALEDVLTRTQKTLYNKYVAGTLTVGNKLPTNTSSKKETKETSKSKRSKKSKSKKD